MKKIAILVASLVTAGAVLDSDASAEPIGGVLERTEPDAPARWTGCRTSVENGNVVQVDSNLNWFGANVNVRPSPNCDLRETAHQTELEAICFFFFARTYVKATASASGEADIIFDCIPYGGGMLSGWSLKAL